MTDQTLNVKVVVHRIYGTAFRWVDRTASGQLWERQANRNLIEMGFHRRRLDAYPDREHGTSRTEGEIRAFFEADDDYDYPGGLTVNDVFAPVGIQWQVVEIRDHAVLSADADLLFQSQLDAVARRLRDPEAANLFCVRDIRGAYGRARSVVASGAPCDYAAIADREGTGGPGFTFRMSVATVAHELGHMLGLPHMPDVENALYTWSQDGPREFRTTQKAIARDRARLLVDRQRSPLVGSELLRLGRIGIVSEHLRDWHFDP